MVRRLIRAPGILAAVAVLALPRLPAPGSQVGLYDISESSIAFHTIANSVSNAQES